MKAVIPRNLTDHKLNELNERINIKAIDEPGTGGANHLYELTLITEVGETAAPIKVCVIEFQNGPIKEAGFNGFTHESLLAVVLDRLRGFQSGPHACRENALALTKCQEALFWLQSRTRERLVRGVEGTNQK